MRRYRLCGLLLAITVTAALIAAARPPAKSTKSAKAPAGAQSGKPQTAGRSSAGKLKRAGAGGPAQAGSPAKAAMPASKRRQKAAPVEPEKVAPDEPDSRAADSPADVDEYPPVEITLTDPGSGAEKFRLRYQFSEGETIRWEVEHRAQVRTTIQGVTQTAETLSNSIKVWNVMDVSGEGRAKFVYSVESVDMRQRIEGRPEVHYNSTTDAVPPSGFEDVAKSVGIELSVMTLDPSGNVLARQERRPDKASTAPPREMITPPLPAEEVAVGATWQIPSDIKVTLQGGEVKKIAARQKYTLDEVSDGLATIKIETVILTPVRDPEIEAQMVQGKSNGTFRFDIALGRIVSQHSDVDEQVVGFQGEGSSMHYVTRFTEKLLAPTAQSARRVGPAAP